MDINCGNIENALYAMKFNKSRKSLLAGLSLLLWIFFPALSAQSGNTINPEALIKAPVDERVILYTDREIYLCGENIVFSAFTYEGNWFIPVSMSSVLYVELYNQDNSVISKGKFLLRNGEGSGIISIPRTIHSDIFYIRAYTNYMKNFGVQQFYVQKLKIVNPKFNAATYSLASPEREVINCGIFPEGGKLVDGISSKVGCRFTGADGKGIHLIARLVDMNKNVITTFQTYKNGFASFNFVPQTGISYSVEAVIGGVQVVTQMPKSSKSGLTLSIDTLTSEFLRIKVNSNSSNNFPLRLNARHGTLLYPLHETLITSAADYNIPLQRIPFGLITLELSDFEGNLVASRYFYYQPFKKFEIELNTDKEKYGNREQVRVMINARDNKGLPLVTDLILFAFLTNNESSQGAHPYPSEGLLSQELKRIFSNDQDLILKAVGDKQLLDLVLLSTPEVNQKDTSTTRSSLYYLPEITGDIISGRLLNNGSQPAKGVEILQSFVGKTSFIESSFTDENGRFYFLTYHHKNKGDLILKVQNTERETTVILDDEFFNKFPSLEKETLILSKEEVALIDKQFINIQVDDAFKAEMKKSVEKTDRDTIAFYGEENLEFRFPEYVNLPNMSEFIFEVILGVINAKESKKDKIIILEENSLKRIGPNPLILIDGIPITESGIVIGLNAEKVQHIKVVRNKYFYKNQVFDGILDVITYTGDATAFELPKNTTRYNFTHANDESSMVESKLLPDNNGRIPVYKNLLYWNSSVTTNKDGKAERSFYTPDNAGNFRIQCFGIATEDLAGSGSTFITVGEK